jgi:hypothetical protein
MTSFDDTALVDDMDSLYPNGTPPEVITAVLRGSLDELDRLSTARHNFFVLGSYDEPEKHRLDALCRVLSVPERDEPFTLEEIDPGVDVWENFYVKFRVFLLRADHVVAVFESNDGGHELEIGEVDLDQVHVLKRDYESVSVDHDLEYAKYDAMLGTLFDLLDRRDRLHEWETKREFYAVAAELSATLGNGHPP